MTTQDEILVETYDFLWICTVDKAQSQQRDLSFGRSHSVEFWDDISVTTRLLLWSTYMEKIASRVD